MIYAHDLVEELTDLLDREDELNADELDDLDELRNLMNEVGDLEELDVLIPVDDFEEYARDQAQSLYGSLMECWPMLSIDWEQAAEELSYDYTEVEFRGETYLTQV